MPFTPSHAIVALPFLRTPLVPGAIAVGAMTPDLPLFVRGIGVGYGFTHTATNVVWTTLIALGLLTLWRVVLRPGLIALAPPLIAARLPGAWRETGQPAVLELFAPRERFGYPLLLVLSLMIGVLSHIAWDAFTHEGRWGVELLPALGEMWGPLRGYKWMQYGSGVFGLVILAIFGTLWVRRQPLLTLRSPVSPWVRWGWMLSLPALLVAGWFLGLARLGPLTAEFTVQHLAYRTLPTAAGLWGVLTILLCIAVVVIVPLRAKRRIPR